MDHHPGDAARVARSPPRAGAAGSAGWGCRAQHVAAQQLLAGVGAGELDAGQPPYGALLAVAAHQVVGGQARDAVRGGDLDLDSPARSVSPSSSCSR